jgi:hypothetical protein
MGVKKTTPSQAMQGEEATGRWLRVAASRISTLQSSGMKSQAVLVLGAGMPGGRRGRRR